MHTRDLYRPVATLGRYEASGAVANEAAKRLLLIPEVSAILLYEDSFEPPTVPIRLQHPLFEATSGTSSAGMRRIALFVLNPKAAVPLRPDERFALLADPSGW